jgi:hypothetical protein
MMAAVIARMMLCTIEKSPGEKGAEALVAALETRFEARVIWFRVPYNAVPARMLQAFHVG